MHVAVVHVPWCLMPSLFWQVRRLQCRAIRSLQFAKSGIVLFNASQQYGGLPILATANGWRNCTQNWACRFTECSKSALLLAIEDGGLLISRESGQEKA